MAIEDLYIDYGIEMAPEGDKHYREHWHNIACPHCTGSEGFHLGFNIIGTYYFCWRCGAHSIPYTLSKILKVGYPRAEAIAREYSVHRSGKQVNTKHLIKIQQKRFKYPSAVSEMTRAHTRYLEKRNFDPEYLKAEWGVMGTGPTSVLDNIPYSYRILVPITWDEKIVSFQCRDYSDKQKLKYMACPEKREIIHHKHLIYGRQQLWGDIGLIVEGVTDVWRMRGWAGATLGIGYTSEQVRLIAELFTEVFILFDPEPQAQQQAEKLVEELRFRGVKAHNYMGLKTDPADLSEDDAQHLLNELKLVPRTTPFFTSS